VPKWKTYNEDLRNARKRKSYHIEGEVEEDDDIEEMPERPIGQKAAKKDARDAKIWMMMENHLHRRLMWRSLTNLAKSRKI